MAATEDVFLLAKAQAFCDICDGKSYSEIVDTFMTTVKDKEIDDQDLIDAFYHILMGKLGNIALLDELKKRFEKQDFYIEQLKISLMLKETSPDVLSYIQNYIVNYGEDKEILLLELNYRVSNNFIERDRINYILSKVKEGEGNVV